MKKLLKILTITAALLTTIILTTCKQFLDDPKEFFEYWSAEVIPSNSAINKPAKTIDGVQCVSSAEEVKVTIKLTNPKNIKL